MMSPKPYILLVEDHYLTQSLIQLFLEQQGFEVICAPDGQAAIHEMQQRPPAVILLDLGLPDYEGIELIEKIKLLSLSPAPVFIAITGSISQELTEAALQAGCVALLEKPINSLSEVNGRSIVESLKAFLAYN